MVIGSSGAVGSCVLCVVNVFENLFYYAEDIMRIKEFVQAALRVRVMDFVFLRNGHFPSWSDTKNRRYYFVLGDEKAIEEFKEQYSESKPHHGTVEI